MISASVSAQRRNACLVTRLIQRHASVIVQRELTLIKSNRNVLECKNQYTNVLTAEKSFLAFTPDANN